MADSFGLSFAPLQQQPGYGGTGTPQDQTTSPIQQAIQILSLRRPTVWGGAAPAAPSLLSGQGGSASLAPTVLQALMQHLQGQFGTQQAAPWQGPAAGDLSDLFGMGQQPPTRIGQGGMTAPAMRNPGPSYPDAPPPTFPTIPQPQIDYNQDQRMLPNFQEEPPAPAAPERPGGMFDRPAREGRRQA